MLQNKISQLAQRLGSHRSLIVEKYGPVKESLILKVRKPEEILPQSLEPKQILVEHLAACVNPADINLIEGVYGKRPELPSVVGNEGVTRVTSVGSEVSHLKPGDIALSPGLVGYWQSYSVQDSGDFYKIDSQLDVPVASQLKVNPCTAYRMIKDFHSLKPGETIIQNGANSAVGVYVIQLAKHWGLRTINVIRDRPNKTQIEDELKGYGADYVVTEDEIGKYDVISPILKKTGKPKLALNCVGGKNGNNCARTLDNGGYFVTYGAMSKQPVLLSASSCIFKNHKYVGFWVSEWYERSQRRDIQAMLDDVSNMFKDGILRSKNYKLIDFDERDVAFEGSKNTKFIFSIDKNK